MDPLRKVVAVAKHERARTTVRVGSQVFGTIRNIAAIGAAVAGLATGGFFVARDATRDATKDAPSAIASPPPLLEQLRGPLAFDLSFQQDIGTPPPLAPSARPTAVISTRADGVDFSGQGNYAPLLLRRQVPAKYVADLVLAARSGTDASFSYTVRSGSSQQYAIVLDAVNEIIRFNHVDSVVQPARTTSLVPNAIPATGLQKGQPLRLSVAVDGVHYRIFVAGGLVADVTDTRVPVVDSTTTNLSMGSSVNKGTLSINSLKVFALAEGASQQSALAQLRGQLVYEPAIARDLATAPPLASGAHPTAIVRPRPAGDVVDILPNGEFAPVVFNRAIPARYVAELDLATVASTDGSLIWTLRGSGTKSVQVTVDPANELVRFQYRDGGVTPIQFVPLIPSAVPVPGLQRGRVLHLAIAVDGTRYRAFLDGEQYADVTDARVPVAANAGTSLNLGANLTRGGYALSKVRVYDMRP